MAKSVTPFLMFEGTAEAAASLYVSLFRDSSIQQIERYGQGENGPEGSVKQCHFVVAGLPLRCFDSPIKHAFTFTPSVSLFVDCESAAELDDVWADQFCFRNAANIVFAENGRFEHNLRSQKSGARSQNADGASSRSRYSSAIIPETDSSSRSASSRVSINA